MHSRKVLGVVFNHNFDYQKSKYQGINQKGIFGIRNKQLHPLLFTKMLRKTSMGSSRWIGKLSCPWEKLFPNTIGLKMSSAEFYGEESADNRRIGYAKTQSIPGFIYHLPVSHSFSIGMSCWERGGWIYRWHTAWIGHDRKRGSSLHQGWHDSMFSAYIRKIVSVYLWVYLSMNSTK